MNVSAKKHPVVDEAAPPVSAKKHPVVDEAAPNVSVSSKLNEIEELECSVCYNKIGETNKCVTPCGHLFCFKCIHKVIKKGNDSCPNCRASFTEETSPVENINNTDLYDDDENILNNNILNNNIILNNTNYSNIINNLDLENDVNIINNINMLNNISMFNIFDNNIINEDLDDETLSNTLSISTSISDIPDEELYNDDNFKGNFWLYTENKPSEKILKIVSILLEKGFNETDIRYIIRKNFNYHIMTQPSLDVSLLSEDKEYDSQELILSNETIDNINILQNELNKILSELELNSNI